MKHAKRIALLCVCTIHIASCSRAASKIIEQKAAVEEKIPSIGVVFAIGNHNDMSLNTAAYRGLVMLARDMKGSIQGDSGARFGQSLSIKVLAPSRDGADREQLLRSLAQEKKDVIIAVGFLFANIIQSVSRDYPNTHFVLIDGIIPDLDPDSRITCVNFAENEGAFLVGAYAGRMAETAGPQSTIGFIGAMNAPIVIKSFVGYAAGAAFMNRKFKQAGYVLSSFSSRDARGFLDKTNAYKSALTMYNYNNSVVIFHEAGFAARGIFEAAKESGKRAIGSGSDQAAVFRASASRTEAELADVICTSMIKRVDTVVYSLGHKLVHGAPIAGGYWNYGIAEGGIGYAFEGVPQDIVMLLTELSQRISNGDIAVPSTEEELEEFLAQLDY